MLKRKYQPTGKEAGCDEAGRGALAGPVFAAAVILPDNFYCEMLNDSKQLSPERRAFLRPFIEKQAVAWAVASVSNREIDEINILNASILAMHRALDKLVVRPDHIIVDGNRFRPYGDIPHKCIVKGDATYMSIAAASILAKTRRDEYMNRLHEKFPSYYWYRNKGYPTPDHRRSIEMFGITDYHRKSFHLIDTQLKFDF